MGVRVRYEIVTVISYRRVKRLEAVKLGGGRGDRAPTPPRARPWGPGVSRGPEAEMPNTNNK